MAPALAWTGRSDPRYFGAVEGSKGLAITGLRRPFRPSATSSMPLPVETTRTTLAWKLGLLGRGFLPPDPHGAVATTESLSLIPARWFSGTRPVVFIRTVAGFTVP